MVSYHSRNRQDPAEMGRARRIWREFMASNLPSLKERKLEAIPADSDRFVVYLATRRSVDAEFVLRNCMRRLGDAWGLQVLVRPELESWIGNIVDGWIGVHLDRVNPHDHGGAGLDLNELARLVSFWETVRGRHQLFVDDESILCHSGVGPFLEYDFVGAPWAENSISPWCRYGSGGLSLRRKDAMITVCRECNTNPWMIGPEDVFYSIVMRLEGDKYRLPTDDLARRFAVEQVYYPEPFALHRAWEYITADKLQGLLERINMPP